MDERDFKPMNKDTQGNADLANVSLRSFNQKIESYEIALKYSKELKEYDRVDRLTIGLAALRLVKREFFPNAS